MRWFAIRVKPNFERRATIALRSRGLDEFLPVYRVRRRWSDRFQTLDLPLFPGYVFCRLDLNHRLPLLTTPGFLYVVSFGNQPAPVDDSEIEAVQSVARSGLPGTPWPSVALGHRVRLECGPLSGLEGVMIRIASQFRVCVSITLLGRGVSVEVNREWIRPLDPVGNRQPEVCSSSLAA